ncbi:MAG: hypothetical protein ACKVTZ_23250 [Bacteroidia bacterium]
MKLLKIILFFFPLSVVILGKTSATNSTHKYDYSSQKHLSFGGKTLQSYELNIDFVDENYTHKHILNEGGLQVDIEVHGKCKHLNIGNVSKITCNYHAIVYSSGNAVDGDIDFQIIATTIGNEKQSKIEKDLRKYVVNKLIKTIEQR